MFNKDICFRLSFYSIVSLTCTWLNI